MIRYLNRYGVGWLLGWILRVTTWIAVSVLGLGTWWEVRIGKSDWSITQVLAAARNDWFWLSVFVIAGLIVFANPGRWIVQQSKRRAVDSDQTNWITVAIDELNRLVKRRSGKDDMRTVWEPLLKAAQMDIERELGLNGTRIKTNLLLCEGDHSIKVVARSRPGSPVPKTYEMIEDSASSMALRNNRPHVAPAIPSLGDRPYKSVVAVPVSSGQNAYGVITADSTGKKDFNGKAEALGAILRPYCSLVLLTLDDKIKARKCPDRYDG